ncbi:elastinolytic metalloproteinase mep [Colletotrichum sojae]|uniref:Extracellular metalloproteinase n=1 Tax=Colletotrichum sojae TaxID=2175907 RepID=A0A8H6N1H4_9PEZI|nr:elastinolytic metalloproteinase mep [Colletotrichum sojae]
MMLLNAIVLLGLAGPAFGHPARGSPQISKRAAMLNSHRFNTVSSYTTLNRSLSLESKTTSRRREEPTDYVQIATLKLREVAPQAAFRLLDDFYVGTNGVAHAHFQQTVDGIDVDNARFKVNVLKDGTILSFGSSFVQEAAESSVSVKRADLSTTPLAAFQRAVELLDLPIEGTATASADPTDGEIYAIKGVKGTVAEPLAKLAYVQVDGFVTLAWRIETETETNWLHTYIDAATGQEVTGVIDFTNTATYEVYPWGVLNPDEGPRETIADPEDTASSPFGWHSDGSQEYTSLRGNNAFVTISDGGSSPSSPDLLFSYPYSPAMTDPKSYTNASATQGYYTVNKYHDILYALGFDEAAGNFQAENNGEGGAGGDALELVIQAQSGTALISVPADGRSPKLTMGGRWPGNPVRDSAFDATVLLHEYTHGVNQRLVGGPASAGCLSGMVGLSIDEGYADFLPTLLRVKEGDTRATDYTIADWSTGQAIGLRSHYVSTSLETTPLTFGSLNNLVNTGGFDLATVWAATLYDVFWNMADEHGIGDVNAVVLDDQGVPKGARYLLLKLILDGNALVPCNPHHLQVRDGLLEADRVLTGGANRCAIWKGFARRGFGEDAVVGSGTRGRVNGFAVPSDC